MNVRFRPRAIRDLNDIADYLTERSLTGALSVERAIRATIGLIADFPQVGRVVSARSAVRVIAVARYPYLVFYEITEGAIFVLHVRHGAREPIGPAEF